MTADNKAGGLWYRRWYQSQQRELKLREALAPFARLAVLDDRMAGLSPGELRDAVAKARVLIQSGGGAQV